MQRRLAEKPLEEPQEELTTVGAEIAAVEGLQPSEQSAEPSEPSECSELSELQPVQDFLVDDAPKRRKLKLFRVTVYKSWEGLHDHLMDHALLRVCADEIKLAGYSFKLPNGSAAFSDPENYRDAIAAERELKPHHILATEPYLAALKEQLKTKPRVKNFRRAGFRDVRLLTNFFGPEGAELRTFSTPSDWQDF